MGRIVRQCAVLLAVCSAVVFTAACSRRVPGISTNTPGKVGIIYTVHKGDSLWRISRMYSISTAELARLNHIKNAAKIKAGERLFIPGSPRMLEKRRRHYLKYGTPAEETAAAQAPGSTSASSGRAGKPSSTHPPQKSPVVSQPKPSKRQSSKYYSTRLKFSWPAKGSVIAHFGSKKGKQNNGLEIKLPRGTSINASEEGEVVYLGEITGYGLTMILAHSNDFYSLYAPLASPSLGLGEVADRGQQIGESGNQSFHFEIRKGKVPLDPMLYIK